MPSLNPITDPNARQELVEEAFCEYLRRMDAGEPIDRDAFVSRYPEVADALAAHLDADSVIRKMAGPTHAEATMNGELDATLVGHTPFGDAGAAEVEPRPGPERDTVLTTQSGDTHPGGKSAHGDIPAEFGRYRVQKLLGQGAMGAVYLAHDTQLDRRVALKIPKFEQGGDADTLERFYREARAVATLHHPNICPVYDVGEIDGRTFLSMAYIQGRPLSDYTKSEKKQGERSAAKLVMKLARALQEAHEIGVVHRDLKPANIMVGQKGEPVVMDFGLARRLDSNDTRVTKSGTIVGTPAYMSPEQVEGDPAAIGPASDQYSLGVILYEMLTGRLPFQGTILSVIGQIAHQSPQEVSKLRPDLDPRLAAICRRMMARNPRDRFADMAAAAEALNKYLVESKTGTALTDGTVDCSIWELIPENEAIASRTKRDPMARSRMGKLPAKRSKSRQKQHPRPWQLWTALGAAALLVVVAVVMLFLQTPEGTVRIEITDPETQVEFAGRTFTFEDDGAKVEVTPGKHALRVKRGSLSFTTNEFTVEKNGETAIKVSWRDNELVAMKGNKAIGRARDVRDPNRITPDPGEIALIHRFEGHRGSGMRGMALDVSADGRWMISAGGEDLTARLWDLKSRKSILTLVGPPSSHACVAISPDGKRGAGLGFEGQVAIWNLETGKMIHSMAHNARGNAITFSPSGRRLITFSEDRAAIAWDVESGKEIARHEFGGFVYACVFLNDDQALVGSNPPSMWDIAGGKVEAKWPTFGCTGMAISADGRTLATSRWDYALQTWNMDSGQPIRRFSGHTQEATSVHFLPNQRYMISGGRDGRIIIWDRQTGREVARKEGLGHLASTVLPLPDGRHAVSSGRWFEGTEPNPVAGDYAIRLWRLPESVWPLAVAE